MPPISQMCRSVWWAFAAGGVAAIVAAGLVAAGLVTAPLGVAAWQALTGIAILVAALRATGGVGRAVPFLGAAGAGIVFGVSGLLVPALDHRITLIGIGIWSAVAAAGYLAIARLARAFGIPDGGLYSIAWLGMGVGIVASTLPAFALGGEVFIQAGALAATGAISILAATRLRVLPDEAPPAVSHREAQRRERAGRRS